MAMTISGSNGVTYPDGTSQASGSQACKAWVNFNGTGTVAIRASYNVSSITDNGTGDYTVNFTTAISDANYSAPMTCSNVTYYSNTAEPLVVAAGSLRVYCWARGTSSTGASAGYDMTTVQAAIFR